MVFSSLSSASPSFLLSPTVSTSLSYTRCQKKVKVVVPETPISSLSSFRFMQKSFPLAASIAVILWSNPVNAGILSGFSGLESVPGPQLPEFDFLKRFNDENQKKYAENDERFKSSSVLKDLLEKSRLNKERNEQEIQDKYCIRGAEWGVGDCSTQGMTEDEKDNFISMLKKKSEEKNRTP